MESDKDESATTTASEKSIQSTYDVGAIAQKVLINHQHKKLDRLQHDFQSNLHDKEEQIKKLRESLEQMKDLQINNELREAKNLSKDEVNAGLRLELAEAHAELNKYKEETQKLIQNIKNTDLHIVLDNRRKCVEMKVANDIKQKENEHLASLLKEQEADIKRQYRVQRALLKTIKENKKDALRYQIRITLKDEHLAKVKELIAMLESKLELLQEQVHMLIKKNKRIRELEDEIMDVLKSHSNMSGTKEELKVRNEKIEKLKAQITEIEMKEIKFDPMKKESFLALPS